MTIHLVNLARQYQRIREEVQGSLCNLMEHADFIGGPRIADFELAFAAHAGTAHAVGVANGTAALEIALRCLGIGTGDEVIVPAMSFIATSEAVRLTGARPVFADIVGSTACLDPECLQTAITPATKAVIAVHLYGRPADMTALARICDNYKIALIGDAAQAHGALHKSKPITAFSRCTCYSFYPGKNLGAYGDAGAVVTNDDKLAEAIRMFANHGRSKKYLHQALGTNARLDALQAAVLSIKLPYLDSWNARRQNLASRYSEALSGLIDLSVPPDAGDDGHVWHLYTVRIKENKRDAILGYLNANGIEAGIHYPVPLHLQPCNLDLGYAKGAMPQSELLAEETLSLPLCPELTDDEQRIVIDSVKAFFQIHSS